MFTIEKTGPRGDRPRLVANAALSRADFEDIANQLGTKPVQAHKTALIAARPAKKGERVDTQWNGSETINAAKQGDWVATSLTTDGKVLRALDKTEVLPRDVDADNIQASFEDVVLTVTIPKSEKARRRKIDVGGTVGAQQVEQQNG